MRKQCLTNSKFMYLTDTFQKKASFVLANVLNNVTIKLERQICLLVWTIFMCERDLWKPYNL